MKILIPVFSLLMFLSSCIKVGPENLCNQTPPAPVPDSSLIIVPQGHAVFVTLVSPNVKYTYNWISPIGYVYTGSSLDLPQSYYYGSPYGVWSVVASSGLACASDTARFIVAPSPLNCNIGRDSFEVTGNFIMPFTFNASYVGQYSYQVNFTDIYGNPLSIYFNQMPAQGTTSYSIVSYDNLNSTQCFINYYTNSDEYNSSSGYLTTTVSGSTITVKFCGAIFTDYNSQQLICNGNFTNY